MLHPGRCRAKQKEARILGEAKDECSGTFLEHTLCWGHQHPPLRLAAGRARPLIDASERDTRVRGLLCQRLASLHRVLGHSSRPGDSRQVHHIRGDITLGESHTYLRDMA